MRKRVEAPPLLVKVSDTRLDFNSAWLVKQWVIELIRDGHQRIALEISDVEFIDSSGLATFASIAQLLDRDGRLVISGARSGVMSMLKLTRLDKVFRIFPDERQAIDALQSFRPASTAPRKLASEEKT
jgi:anti-sigma B factor antagonist